jgi:hypothetical protein
MEKSVFKVGDKVFDYRYGWGIVNFIVDKSFYPINVKFGEYSYDYTWDGRAFLDLSQVLSFTEYTLEGFSQERPEELPKKGQIIWGRGELPSEWHIGYFFEKRGDKYLINSHPNPSLWHSEVIEITTEDPYIQI